MAKRRREVVRAGLSVFACLAGCSSQSTERSTIRESTTTDQTVENSTKTTKNPTTAETTTRHERIEDKSLPAGGSWPTYHYDKQNTSHSPDSRGVRTNGTPYWRIKSARTPIVKDKRMYMPEGRTVVARDAATGVLQWKTELEIPEMVGVNSPVAIADGRIYATTREMILSFDSSTGSITWSNKLSDSGQSVPTIDDDTVYLCNGGRKSGKAYAFNANDGEKRWERTVSGAVAEAVAIDDETIYVGADSLYALAKSSGDEKWTISTTDSISLPPVVTGNHVYVTDSRTLYAIRKTGEVDWKIPDVRVNGLSVTERFVFYSVQGGLVALERESGIERWRFETQGNPGPPSVGNDTIYFGTGVHERVLRALDTANGELRWRYKGNLIEDGDTYRGGFNSTPVIVDDAVYLVSGDGYLYAFGKE